MLVFIDLLIEIAKEGKHTFISTGMSTYDDIQKAVDIFKSYNCPFELMHTVSTYPMKDEDANLNLINNLRERFKCNVGYSGHETGLAISGSSSYESPPLKDILLLIDQMYGSDQSASLEPQGLRQLVEV